MNFRNIVFGFGIFILTLFVGMYGISTLYGSSPQYDDFCPTYLIDEATCEAEGGEWVSEQNTGPFPAEGTPTKANGYCQFDYRSCQDELEIAQEAHYKKVFYTAMPLGIAIIFFGAMFFGIEVVGAGLMLGGVSLIIYGSGAYWRFTDDWVKFLMSLVGLVLLIYIAYGFNEGGIKFFKKRIGPKRN